MGQAGRNQRINPNYIYVAKDIITRRQQQQQQQNVRESVWFLGNFQNIYERGPQTQYEGNWKWNCRFFILQSLWDMNSMRKGREKEEEWPDCI